MQVTKPILTKDLLNDPTGVQVRHARLMGVNFRSKQAVWRFGFLAGSEDAGAFGVSVPQQLDVLGRFDGTLLESGYFTDEEMPEDFLEAMDTKFVRPDLKVSGDVDGVQARHAWLIGVSPVFCLWRFGFDPNTEDAKAFNIFLEGPKIYVLAPPSGEIEEQFGANSTSELPLRMRKLLRKT